MVVLHLRHCQRPLSSRRVERIVSFGLGAVLDALIANVRSAPKALAQKNSIQTLAESKVRFKKTQKSGVSTKDKRAA